MFVRLARELIHEAQIHTLRHPNIIMLIAVVFEHGQRPVDAGHYGIVFEFVLYGGLDNFIKNYEVTFHAVF